LNQATEAAAGIAVRSCPAPLRLSALQKLAAARHESDLAELVAAIKTIPNQAQAPWYGLLIAQEHDQEPAAAVWTQPQPGGTARLWPPPSDSPWAQDLLRAAALWSQQQALHIVQAVIDTSDHEAARLLQENGFPWLVDLLYLGAATGGPADHAEGARGVAGETRLESIDRLPSPRLDALMRTIEDGSLDCPGLHGVLSPSQAIEGFRHQGQFDPEHWCILRHRNQDAGALLLTSHPPTNAWELMYMGVLPQWRGHGLGARLIDEAFARAANAGAEQLLLSVDIRNEPALQLYERAGFRPYARRSLYARVSDRRGIPDAAAPGTSDDRSADR
jgi:ribosomal protein S18 acetylase RimI-like enzyme